MCVMSMIMDHGLEKLQEWRTLPLCPQVPNQFPYAIPGMPTKMDLDNFIKDFEKLLEKAKKYDADNGQPDCEVEAKKVKLKAMADELGIAIEFE